MDQNLPLTWKTSTRSHGPLSIEQTHTTALRDALAWIDAADIACFETLIPKRQDILNAKSTRPRGSRLHEYRDLSGELKQTMRQLKDKEEDL